VPAQVLVLVLVLVRAQAQAQAQAQARATHCRWARQHRPNCSTRHRMKRGGQGTGS